AYKNYNKSQLQEMLTMSDGQIEQVTPGMSIKDIRKIKNPEVEEDIIAETEEPAAVEGETEEIQQEAAGVSESCDIATDSVNTESEVHFSCDMSTEESQTVYAVIDTEESTEESQTVYAVFDTEELMKEMDDDTVDGEYREVTEDVQEVDAEPAETDSEDDDSIDDYRLLSDMLEKENKLLDQMICVQKDEGLREELLRRQKIKVAALANMKCEIENTEELNKEKNIRAITEMEMIESLNKAWREMTKHYSESPDENMRCAMNILARIIGEVQSEVKTRHAKRLNMIISMRQQA
ncbi:MAG: hypothetical protein NC313_15150, partial [Butyrivibrio sp.]|nr:hypothetical protein [Butyrivibrio sp.]